MMESPQLPPENLPQPKQEQPAPPNQPKSTPSIESKTREYLSNERTYLSWMRTAISLMGIGVILGRIHAGQTPLALDADTPWRLGLIFAVVGLITVFLATQHYLAVQREITSNNDEVIGRWVIVFSIVVLLIGSGIVYYVLAYVLAYMPIAQPAKPV